MSAMHSMWMHTLDLWTYDSTWTSVSFRKSDPDCAKNAAILELHPLKPADDCCVLLFVLSNVSGLDRFQDLSVFSVRVPVYHS